MLIAVARAADAEARDAFDDVDEETVQGGEEKIVVR